VIFAISDQIFRSMKNANPKYTNIRSLLVIFSSMYIHNVCWKYFNFFTNDYW